MPKTVVFVQGGKKKEEQYPWMFFHLDPFTEPKSEPVDLVFFDYPAGKRKIWRNHTLMRGKAHEQAVAVAVLGEARRTEALPGIARQLVNPFPLVRYYAKRAVDTLADRPCAVDLDRTTPEIVAAVRACVPAAFPEPVPAALPAKPRTRTDDTDEY